MAGLGVGVVLTLWPTMIGSAKGLRLRSAWLRPSPVLVREVEPSRADPLAWAYAGSLLQLAMRLEDGPALACQPSAGETPLCGLALEVCADTAPLAHAAGRRLTCDIRRSDRAEWPVHPGLCSLVIRHLILRALLLERPGGDVRVEVVGEGDGGAVRVLSRAGPRQPVGRSMEGQSELCALQRLAREMGGTLTVEIVRGGRLALGVTLTPDAGVGVPPLALQAA